MARYISYKTVEGGFTHIIKVHSSDASKTLWDTLVPDLNFKTINEDEFKKLKYLHPYSIDENNNLVFKTPPEGQSFTRNVTQYTVEKNLDKHIKDAEHFATAHDNPIVSPVITQEYINSLKAIDTNAITWPVNCLNWVEALELNSHSLDSILEV